MKDFISIGATPCAGARRRMGVQTRRWLRALQIAKVLFEHEGYHSVYLEEIEDFIRMTYEREPCGEREK